MCLPNFEKFINVDQSKGLTGYRTWRLRIKEPAILLSEFQEYKWDKIIEGPHKVKDINSGIYAYNNDHNNYYHNNYYYNNYYYNNYYSNYYKYNYNYNNDHYNYYNNYNNNYNNNYYNNYNNINGIISQYGRVAIHKTGQRSEYAKISKLFTIRRLDAQGPKEFLSWIDKFNRIIANLASKYQCETCTWQDFNDSTPQK
jgi:hypothetical protein